MEVSGWIIGLGVPLVGVLLAIDKLIHARAESAIREKDAEIATLHERVNSITKEFNDYRVGSATLFATVTAVGEVKRELMSSLGRIEDKLDRIAERNERRDQR